MKLFKVTLTGSHTMKIKAENEDDAYMEAFEIAEQIMMHDFIDDGEVEEIKKQEVTK